ncbi:hypothetical protein J6590_058105 [Homalodisca vitripennis]|nr:hypothetical protein J6590_058105 [Homalodisca vitripennis]
MSYVCYIRDRKVLMALLKLLLVLGNNTDDLLRLFCKAFRILSDTARQCVLSLCEFIAEDTMAPPKSSDSGGLTDVEWLSREFWRDDAARRSVARTPGCPPRQTGRYRLTPRALRWAPPSGTVHCSRQLADKSVRAEILRLSKTSIQAAILTKTGTNNALLIPFFRYTKVLHVIRFMQGRCFGIPWNKYPRALLRHAWTYCHGYTN